jgi:hypothetical protein
MEGAQVLQVGDLLHYKLRQGFDGIIPEDFGIVLKVEVKESIVTVYWYNDGETTMEQRILQVGYHIRRVS